MSVIKYRNPDGTYTSLGFGSTQGPPGPSAVSADADNAATLGSDSLIYVPDQYVKTTGDTMTGNLEVYKDNGSAEVTVHNWDEDIKVRMWTSTSVQQGFLGATASNTSTLAPLQIRGSRIEVLQDPTTALSVATKQYVDGKAAGYPQRTVTNSPTSSLAVGASASSNITLALSYRLLKVTLSHPARFRLYATVAQRNADLSRPIGTDPTGDHGLVFEYVATSGLLGSVLTPQVSGSNMETTPSVDQPYSITNTGASTASIMATFTWIRTE